MARLISIGWETRNLAQGAPADSSSGTSTQSINTSIFRSGTAALSLSGTAAGGASGFFRKNYILSGTPSEIFIRFGIRHTGGSGLGGNGERTGFLRILDSVGGLHLEFFHQVSAGNIIKVFHNGVEIASGGVISSTEISLVEIHIIINNSTGVVQVKVNGTQTINFSGDTQNTANANIGGVQLEALRLSDSGGAAFVFDDFAVNDTAGSINNSWLGAGGITRLLPTADTADKDFSRSAGNDNFALVDEVPTDGDTTYVQGSVVNDRDLYEFGDIGGPGIVDNVIVYANMRSANGSGGQAAITIDPGTPVEGTTQALPETFALYQESYEVNPETTNRWTVSEVNSLKAGLTVK